MPPQYGPTNLGSYYSPGEPEPGTSAGAIQAMLEAGTLQRNQNGQLVVTSTGMVLPATGNPDQDFMILSTVMPEQAAEARRIASESRRDAASNQGTTADPVIQDLIEQGELGTAGGGFTNDQGSFLANVITDPGVIESLVHGQQDAQRDRDTTNFYESGPSPDQIDPVDLSAVLQQIETERPDVISEGTPSDTPAPTVEELIQQANDLLDEQVEHEQITDEDFWGTPFPEEPEEDPLPEIADPPVWTWPPMPPQEGGGGLLDIIQDVIGGSPTNNPPQTGGTPTGGDQVPPPTEEEAFPGEHDQQNPIDIESILEGVLGSIFNGGGPGSGSISNTIQDLIRQNISISDLIEQSVSSNSTVGDTSANASIGDQIVQDILGDVAGGSVGDTSATVGNVAGGSVGNVAGGSLNIDPGAFQSGGGSASIGDVFAEAGQGGSVNIDSGAFNFNDMLRGAFDGALRGVFGPGTFEGAGGAASVGNLSTGASTATGGNVVIDPGAFDFSGLFQAGALDGAGGDSSSSSNIAEGAVQNSINVDNSGFADQIGALASGALGLPGDIFDGIKDIITGDGGFTDAISGIVDGLSQGGQNDDLLPQIIDYFENRSETNAYRDVGEQQIQHARDIFDQIRTDLQPYRTAGEAAAPDLYNAASTSPDRSTLTGFRDQQNIDPTVDINTLVNDQDLLDRTFGGFRDLSAIDVDTSPIDGLITQGSQEWQDIVDEQVRQMSNMQLAKGKFGSGETVVDLMPRAMNLALGQIEGINNSRTNQALAKRASDFNQTSGARRQLAGEQLDASSLGFGQISNARDQMFRDAFNNTTSTIANQFGLNDQMFGQDTARRDQMWRELLQEDTLDFDKLMQLATMGQNAATQTGNAAVSLSPGVNRALETIGTGNVARRDGTYGAYRDLLGIG